MHSSYCQEQTGVFLLLLHYHHHHHLHYHQWSQLAFHLRNIREVVANYQSSLSAEAVLFG
jgi:hypothetical protein